MISKEDKIRLKGLISETIVLLCKNGLSSECRSEFTIDGVIGITMDTDELLLVAINQVVKNDFTDTPKKAHSKRLSDVSIYGPADKRSRGSLKKKSQNRSESIKMEVNRSANEHTRIVSQSHKTSNNTILRTPDPMIKFGSPGPLFSSRNVSPTSFSMIPYVSNTGTPNRSHWEKPLDFTVEPLRIKQESSNEFGTEGRNGSPLASYFSKDDRLRVAEHSRSPVLIHPGQSFSPYHLYATTMRLQQSVTAATRPSSPVPSVSPRDKTKIWEKRGNSASKCDQPPPGATESLHTAAVYAQLGQSILRSEGCFVTSRIMTRKTGRKAKMVREVMFALSLPHEHPEHMGVAREIGKNMLVFYKCPPDVIRPSALLKYGLDVNTYSALFYGSLKNPPSQSILPIVLRDSPYMCAHYDSILRNLTPTTNTSDVLNRTANKTYSIHNEITRDMNYENTEDQHSGFDLRIASQPCETAHTSNSNPTDSETNCHQTTYTPDTNMDDSVHSQDFNDKSSNMDFKVENYDKDEDSDIENIDILNDSGQQDTSTNDTATCERRESRILDFSRNFQGQNGDAESSHSDTFNSPLQGLQRMVSSHGSF